MSVETNTLYEFGEYQLDAVERRLLRGDQSIALTPKAFETLLVLVQHSGHLVGKDLLMKQVWSDAFVEEANIARNIWTLRKALGDDEGEHRYIETVPKLGYRFVVPVREVDRVTVDEPSHGANSTANETATDSPGLALIRRTTHSTRAWIIIVLLSVTVAAFGYGAFSRRASTAPEPENSSVSVGSLKSVSSKEEQTGSTSPEANDYYWQAMVHAQLQDRAENNAAVDLLEKAVAIDPNFAAAYAALAREYNSRATALTPEEKQWAGKALAAVNRALDLNPNLADAHLTRAVMLWTPLYRFPHQQAVEELRRALALNPNLDEAHHQLGVVYIHMGLLQQGLGEFKEAIRLNPTNSGAQFRVGVDLLYQSRYEEALSVFREAKRFNPPFWSYQIAYALFQLGKNDEAAEIIAEAIKNNQQDEGGLLTSMEAMLAASSGDTRRAEDKIKRAAELGKDYIHFHHTEYTIASAYALMNNRALALEWLKKTAADGFPCYPLFEQDPNLNNLRDDPKFNVFMKTLKEQWERYNATL